MHTRRGRERAGMVAKEAGEKDVVWKVHTLVHAIGIKALQRVKSCEMGSETCL